MKAQMFALPGFLAFSLVGMGCLEGSKNNEPEPNIVQIAQDAGNFTTLVGALQATGLDNTLAGEGPFTVFAPTDEAFARLPNGVLESLDTGTLSKILTYHVVSGAVDSTTVVGLAGQSATTLSDVSDPDVSIQVIDSAVILNGNVRVTTTDIRASNGIIHVVDAVLLPGSIPFPGTITDALSAHPYFSTLVGAVVGADLAGTLASDNNGNGYTVFAPTNAAFASLGVDLSALTTQQLTDVLLYHVVSGAVPAETVVGLSSATTLQGGDVSISIENGKVLLDGKATVIRADWHTSNGVIHVIDDVLLP